MTNEKGNFVCPDSSQITRLLPGFESVAVMAASDLFLEDGKGATWPQWGDVR